MQGWRRVAIGPVPVQHWKYFGYRKSLKKELYDGVAGFIFLLYTHG